MTSFGRRGLILSVAVVAALGGCTDTSSPERTTAEETPADGDARATGEDTRRLQGDVAYRKFCSARKSSTPTSIAAYNGEEVVLTSVDGGETARIPGRPPVRWSPSGRLLAVGPRGRIWTDEGEPFEGKDTPLQLTRERDAEWAWSPSGDCALVLSEGRLTAFHTGAGANSVILIEEGVESFRWGPGSEVAVVTDEGTRRSLWLADLRQGEMERLREFPKNVCCVTLAGWVPEGDRILFWAAPGESVMQDGWDLQSVDRRGRTRNWGVTLPRPETVARCGNQLVALTGGDREQDGNRLAVLGEAREPRPFSPAGNYTGITCSSDGRYVVASAENGLELYGVGGSRVAALTAELTATDALPDWGPPRSGVLFVRQRDDTQQLWFIPEGGRARFVMNLGQIGGAPSDAGFDWASTEPTGGPAGDGNKKPE